MAVPAVKRGVNEMQLGERQMRAADGDKINVRTAGIELPPGICEHLAVDGHPVRSGRRRHAGFGCVAGDMEHRRAGCAAEGGADRLHGIVIDIHLLQPAQQRYPVRRELAEHPAEKGPETVIDIRRNRCKLDDPPCLPAAVRIGAAIGRAARHGDEQVQVIGNFQRARAKNAVGIDHRVGFRPADALAGCRRIAQQIGSAGKARHRAHIDIAVGKPAGA